MPYFFAQRFQEYAVKNYGSPGIGISHSLVILQRRILEKGALIVVLTSPWHARRSACIDPWFAGHPRFVLDAQGNLVRDGVCSDFYARASNVRLLKHSKVYNYVGRLLKSTLESQKTVLDLYVAILREMKHIADTRSQRLIVAYMKDEEAPLRVLDQSNDGVMSELKRSGIELVDVTLSSSADTVPRQYYLHEEDHHPTAAANERRARLLTEYLQSARH